jgi:hypothetical protein
MLRIVKLYKASNTVGAKKEDGEHNEEDELLEEMARKRNELAQKEEASEPLPEESKIGKMLSDETTKRVIVMVLIVMLSVPLFSFYTYANETKSFQYGLDIITNYHSSPTGTAFQHSFNNYLNIHREIRTPIIYLQAMQLKFEDTSINLDYLRNTEKEIVAASNDALTDQYLAVFDLRPDTWMDALLGILQTIFVCIMLTIGTFLFTKDATDLVIDPVEQMMEKVKKIAKNPLEAAKEEENEALAIQRAEAEQRRLDATRCCKVGLSISRFVSVAKRNPSRPPPYSRRSSRWARCLPSAWATLVVKSSLRTWPSTPATPASTLYCPARRCFRFSGSATSGISRTRPRCCRYREDRQW